MTFVISNYNETYQTVIYNGDTAKGHVDLLIDSEIINSWDYEIAPEGKINFEYKWVATSGRHDFEVVAYVVDGEEINDNNNLTKSIRIEVETSTGLLSNLSFGIILCSMIFVSYFSRRKAN